MLAYRNTHVVIGTKNFNPHKDFYDHWNSLGLNYKSWGKKLGKLMNCLLSTLYAFWKTNSPDQGDYCYLLVYCGSFWTLQLRLGHHCVRHLEAPQREPGSAWRHCVAEEGRHERVGKGNQSFRKGCGSCPGACTHPDPVFKSTLWAEKKLHFPLLYSHRICWSPVFYLPFRTFQAQFCPHFPFSPSWLLSILRDYHCPWAKPCMVSSMVGMRSSLETQLL